MDLTTEAQTDNPGEIRELPHAPCATLSPATVWMRRGAVAVGFLVAAAIIDLALCYLEAGSPWILRLLLAAAVASLVACIASRRWRQWGEPGQRLAELICDIRAGNAPIDDLSKIRGSLAVVAAETKLIFQQMRIYQQQLARQDVDVRDRVANRTSALERMIGSLRNQANRDTLTGLFNRRMLDQLMPQIVRQCLTDGTPLAMQMIDVDYFKDLNDTLGHVAGDQMLRSIGQIIRSTIRATDFGFRYGGDEFVILMPGCPGPAAQRIAERLQSLAYAMTAAYRLPRRPKLSIGVCTLADLKDPTPENLLQRADALLYEQKQARKEPSRPAEQILPERKAV